MEKHRIKLLTSRKHQNQNACLSLAAAAGGAAAIEGCFSTSSSSAASSPASHHSIFCSGAGDGSCFDEQRQSIKLICS